MKIILSTNNDEIQVSDEDFDHVNQWNWSAVIRDGNVVGIIARHGNKVIRLSHVILKYRGITFKGEIDHKDRNPFNNQLENLRPATRSQNTANRGLHKSNTTGYKGVSYQRAKNKYVVSICVQTVQIHLGYFTDLTEAAKAYDQAAKQYHKEFAVLNFP